MSNGRPVHPRSIDEIGEWSDTADVVIVGYGVAGAAAAVEAAAQGAEVIVLERAGGWGGAASLSGGFIYLGGGTATQAACGFDDSPDEMFKFLMAAMGPGADEAKTRIYSDESVAHHDWLVDLGVYFKPEFYGEPGWVPEGDQGLMYSGGENAWPFNEIAEPAPRGHLPQLPTGADRTGSQTSPGGTSERGGGYYLMEPLVRRAESLGVRAIYDVRTDALVTDGDGRVVGVIGSQFGTEIAIRARRGVILAAGSFIFNDDMVARFAPEMVGRPGSATELHDGHGIRMAHALGADLGRMDGCEVATGVNPQLLCRGIVVNRIGQRFVTEDTYPGRVAQHIKFKQDDQAFLIVDEESYEAAPASSAIGPKVPPDWVCGSVAELEAEMGLPDGALAATVDLYNRYAEQGDDPLFHKNAKWIKPLRAPIGAYDLRNRTGGFTLGGLRTDVDGRVLHVSGDPIPGLHAAGRTASGIPVWGYASGASLGDGSFFGRLAGRAAAAAAEQPVDV